MAFRTKPKVFTMAQEALHIPAPDRSWSLHPGNVIETGGGTCWPETTGKRGWAGSFGGYPYLDSFSRSQLDSETRGGN